MMKRAILVIGIIVSAAVARAGDAKVEVFMTTAPEEEATTTFAPDTPKFYAIFKTTGIKKGDKARGVLIAEDVGDAAPANTKVLDETIDLDEDTDDGDFNFSKPDNGWPVGKYRVEIYVNDELAAKAKFTVEAVKSKKSSDKDSDE